MLGRSLCARRAVASDVAEAEPVVDVEERGLELGLDAVRDEEPLDRADEAVLLSRELCPALRAVEVAEEADVLRQRYAARPLDAATRSRAARRPRAASTRARASSAYT